MTPAEQIRAVVEQYVPDGFRDEDGVWHDGPLRREALAALDALEADRADRVWLTRDEAKCALRWYGRDWTIEAEDDALADKLNKRIGDKP